MCQGGKHTSIGECGRYHNTGFVCVVEGWGLSLGAGEFGEALSSSVVFRQNQHLASSAAALGLPIVGYGLTWSSFIGGRGLDFCFSRWKTRCDHFYLGSCLSLQSR